MKTEKYDLGPKLGQVITKEELERLDKPCCGFAIAPLAPIEPQPFCLTFTQNNSTTIGTFYMQDDNKLYFDGDLSESGQIFINFILQHINMGRVNYA